jgi:hypothetical protein
MFAATGTLGVTTAGAADAGEVFLGHWKRQCICPQSVHGLGGGMPFSACSLAQLPRPEHNLDDAWAA